MESTSEDVPPDESSHFQELCLEMYEQYREGSFFDFTIHTRDEDIGCHRLIIAAAFPYFKGLFEGNKLLDKGTCNETDLSNLDTEALKRLLEFAYTSNITLGEECVEEVIQAARYLHVDKVTRLCDRFLVDIVTRDNCCRWYVVGSKFSLPLITVKAQKLLLDFFPKLVHSESFVHLHVRCLQALLESDMLNVPSEEVVLQAMAAWVSYNVAERQMAVDQLFRSVRLNHCPEGLLQALLDDPQYTVLATQRFKNYIRSALRERFGHCRRSKKRSSVPKIQQPPRHSFSTDKLMVVGGKALGNRDSASDSGMTTRDCMYWDRELQEWCPFTELPAHYVKCHGWTACATAGRIFVSGGKVEENETRHWEGSSEVWMWYRNRWHALPSMQHGRWAHGMIYASHKLFCFGGKLRKQSSHAMHSKHNEFLDLDQLEQEQESRQQTQREQAEQDSESPNVAGSPLTCQWKNTTAMKFSFYSPLLAVLGESIYILGMMGWPDRFVDQVYEYNITRKKFLVKSTMPEKAHSGQAITINDTILVCGSDFTTKFMRYTPATDTWCNLGATVLTSQPSSTNIYRDYISPLVYRDGRIILAKWTRAGKKEDRTETTVAEYTPDDNTWRCSDITLPDTYKNKHAVLFNVEMELF